MKTLRKKVLRSKLENQLEKYERRIYKMALNAAELRNMLARLDAKEKEDAVFNAGKERTDGLGLPDGNAGGSQLSNNEIVDPVLESESEEIPVN